MTAAHRVIVEKQICCGVRDAAELRITPIKSTRDRPTYFKYLTIRNVLFSCKFDSFSIEFYPPPPVYIFFFCIRAQIPEGF